MTDLLTAAQMRAVEQAAIASGAVTGLELMERAGAGVVAALLAEWPDLGATAHRAVVLCGPGNNGGDGFVVARLLKERGWEVDVFLYGDEDRLPPDAALNRDRWRGEVQSLTAEALERHNRALFGTDGIDGVIVDALFGTGLSRPLDSELDRCLGLARSLVPMSMLRAVAVDVASGVCADSGRTLGAGHVPACDLTVTFHRARQGHHLADGPGMSGSLRVVPIGLDADPGKAVASIMRDIASALATGVSLREHLRAEIDHFSFVPPILAPVRLAGWEAELDKAQSAGHHKYTHGHALVLSGPATRGGAARLSARAALRIGAGLVTLGAPAEALVENAARLDAVMLREVTSAADLDALLEDERLNALCLGPGLGEDRAAELVPAALAAKRATVLDADALTFFAKTAAAGEHPYPGLNETCVLTPHAGEFARLFPDLAARLGEPATSGPAFSKVDATREAARRAGCTILFKGPDTVIADQTGRCAVNSSAYDRAAPWLATAGTGDVLAGMVAGLLARHFAPFEAAETAAWLHTECALSFGPGLIAEDLPEELPKVFRRLGL